MGDLVDEHYGDLQVVKREAKKRDVLSFALGMKEATSSRPSTAGRCGWGGAGRAGKAPVHRRDDASDAGGDLVPDVAPEVKALPGSIRTRVRFKGEDVLDLTDLAGPLEDLTRG